MDKKETSWGNVADWYQDLLAGDNTYQEEVILPNLLRVLELKDKEKILDLACGEGFFSRAFMKEGANVAASDISPELIAIAKSKSPSGIDFRVASADALPFPDRSFKKVTIVLALQNIENMSGTIAECSRVLSTNGELFIVLNHPAFRIPKHSLWGKDEEKKVQYRRIDAYMSESKTEIGMNPGEDTKKTTISFHRPLQLYFKVLAKNNFTVSRLEEWVSHKKSEEGPNAALEDKARKEIPMFMLLKCTKLS
ncbi:MAG: class I SAM-dependent methyltransferase [Patescibacteria group bacterium]